MAQRELFVNSVRQIRFGDGIIIPTVVYYEGKTPFVGVEALERCEDPARLREDFKVQLGDAEPLKLAKSGSRAGEGGRSLLGICKDFVDSVFQKALTIVQMTGCELPTRVLVAEPISISQDQVANENWLNNYRAALKRVLASNIAEVDFMPEPFAVFQYYRYGTRHALVAQKIKHVALVLDFGGGTFDASVIETTADGDISKKGRNSKPLAAKSIAIGGFYINRILAEHLLYKGLDKTTDKSSVRKALDKFSELKNADDEELKGYQTGLANCIRNYRRLLRSVEQAKISVCNGIPSWKLDADLNKAPACSVPVPQQPLSENTPWVSVRLGASEIRTIYEDRIWKQRLLPAIKETLQRADAELSGKPISVVLLSGGSSNIRWFKPLMERDVSRELGAAEILELSENFQEIVSKGLAIECARRFYTEGEGDFRAVTYNRLCLTLAPNNNEPEVRRFSPDCSEIKHLELDPGVLLPSSTSLKGLADKPLRWRVRLTKAPTQRLDYYFMRSSFDHTEASALQNIDHTVFTPKDASFGSSILVELLVKEDGTTEPTFIYGHGEQGRNTPVKGRAFALDMTYAANERGVDTYLGFDFGTSTSSLCYVQADDVRVFAQRSSDRTWLNLNALVDVIPYIASHPLARFMSATGREEGDRWGREAFEAMMTLITYICYQEHCTLNDGKTSHFKGLKRSAGPLWDLFKKCADGTGRRWAFAREALRLREGNLFIEVNDAVSQIAMAKHGKLSGALDYPRLLEQVGNVLNKLMAGKLLGYFEDIRRVPFSMNRYAGIFRNARGPSSPFIDLYCYEGAENYPPEYVFVFDINAQLGLTLYPLILRGLDANRPGYLDPDFFAFDIARERDVGYKAVQERQEVTISSEGDYAVVYNEIMGRFGTDRPQTWVQGMQLKPRDVE